MTLKCLLYVCLFCCYWSSTIWCGVEVLPKALEQAHPALHELSQAFPPEEYLSSKAYDSRAHQGVAVVLNREKCEQLKSISSTHAYTQFGPFSVEEAYRYKISVLCHKHRELSGMFQMTFLSQGKVHSQIYLHTLPHGSSDTAIRWEKEFFTPRQVDEVIFWFGMSRLDKNGLTPFKSGEWIRFSDWQLEALEPVKPSSALTYGVNLLDLQAFNDHKEGPFEPKQCSNLRLGKSSKAAQIMKVNGQTVLKVFKAAKDYRYPRITANVQPAGQLLKWSFWAKGHGEVRPGIWFNRKPYGWVYRHNHKFTLTDTWQKVSFETGCEYPLSQSVACAFTKASAEMEIEIKEMSLEYVDPVPPPLNPIVE